MGGKQERRKEIAQIAMMHPRTYVAQTTCAHINHFYKSVLGALEFDGPAIVVCYTTCQPEHGVADNMAGEQARLAVDSRAFPILIYDPAQGRHDQGTAVAAGQPGREGRLVHQPQDQGGGDLHRLRPQRGPLRQALRQGRQPVGDAAARQAGPAGELAPAAGTGRTAVILPRQGRIHHAASSQTRRTAPLAVHDYARAAWTPPWTFLKRTRAELRLLRMVRLGKDLLHVYDVNKDFVRGPRHRLPRRRRGAALAERQHGLQPRDDPRPTDAEYKEFDTGRRHPWAEDRVM